MVRVRGSGARGQNASFKCNMRVSLKMKSGCTRAEYHFIHIWNLKSNFILTRERYIIIIQGEQNSINSINDLLSRILLKYLSVTHVSH